MHTTQRSILFGMLVAVAAGCAGPAPSLGPSIWIDAPLPGAHLPLDPYDVISHASSPLGVASFELSVNGQVVLTSVVAGAEYGETLAHISQTWSPAGPGTYMISVRAADPGGSFGPFAEARVTVGLPTPTPTATVTPTATAAGASLSDPSFSTDTFYYRRAALAGASCGDEEETIMTTAHDRRIQSVVLFFRLAEDGGTGRTDWTAVAMNPQGEGGFARTLASEEIPGFAEFEESFLHVQLVATDAGGNEIARTEVLSEVMLLPCP